MTFKFSVKIEVHKPFDSTHAFPMEIFKKNFGCTACPIVLKLNRSLLITGSESGKMPQSSHPPTLFFGLSIAY